MFAPRLPRLGTHAAWREAARALATTPPEAVDWGWQDRGASMFDAPLPVSSAALSVPKGFDALSRTLMAERTGEGFAVSHALLHRLQAERGLMSRRADPLVVRAERMAKDVRRDIHKMHAFLRFKEVPGDGRRRFAAWFEPSHRIEETTADFFVNRFGDMDWVIVTPEVTLRYLGGTLEMQAVASGRPDESDPLEQLWTTYYSNIFNPARLKLNAMRAEMPKKYWKNMPETAAIPGLVAEARKRVEAMQAAPMRAPRTAAPRQIAPIADDLPGLAVRLQACTACPIHCGATQAVMGEGPPQAPVMIVGEQPGDREDLVGRPFVGPAGQLFDQVAARAGLDRSACYVTNAVKHFKYIQRGKTRLHQRPDAAEIRACRSWLMQEIALVRPRLLVAMGATAAEALTGRGTGILARRGTLEETPFGLPVWITIHPSALLRMPDATARADARRQFESDLAAIPEMLKKQAK